MFSNSSFFYSSNFLAWLSEQMLSHGLDDEVQEYFLGMINDKEADIDDIISWLVSVIHTINDCMAILMCCYFLGWQL
jgi:hypothetical protein